MIVAVCQLSLAVGDPGANLAAAAGAVESAAAAGAGLDLELPEWVRRAALAGADLIAAPVNWPAAPRPPADRRPGLYTDR